MRLRYLTLFSLLILACGPGGSTTDGSSSGGTSGTPPTTETGTTDVGTTAATGDPSLPTTGDPSLSTTGDPTTDGGSITSVSGSTAVDDTGVVTTNLTTEAQTSTGTTGEPPEFGPCEQDSDCKLHDDCCTCEGIPADLDFAVCDAECKQSKCSELGIEAAVCRFGVCQTARLTCDQTQVACDEAPPPCPKGQLPTTTPNCWTGQCVPAELCDVVPDCSFCPAGRVCVADVGFVVENVRCEPIPADCGKQVDCACAGELVCEDPFGFCTDQPGDVIHCECINC